MKKFLIPVFVLVFVSNIFLKGQVPADSIYFGFQAPGDSAIVFAPGFISLEGRNERTPNYLPDYSAFYFTTTVPGSKAYSTTYSDGWATPSADSSFRENTSDLSISESGNLACFTSWEGTYDGGSTNSDIYLIQHADSGWGVPELLPEPVNTSIQEWGACVLDNLTIYVCQIIDYSHSDIVKYVPDDGSYIRVNLPQVNSNKNEWDPFIPEDESYIIFKSNRAGGYGGMDLYITYRKEDNSYTNPKNLGQKINSTEHEDCGNVTPDGSYFIFARGAANQNSVDLYWVNTNFIDSMKHTNFGPYVKNSIPDLDLAINDYFEYTVPDSIFFDDDGIETLSYSATMYLEEEWPGWLSFIPGTKTFSGIPPEEGRIYIQVTATDTANSSISDVFSLNVTAPEHLNNSLTSSIKIFPNPVGDVLNLGNLPAGIMPVNYEIIDITGHIIQKGICSKSSIPVSSLSEGLYILELKKNSEELVHRLIIKK